MKAVCKVEFKPGTKEELLPDFDPNFPYIATCCTLQEGSIAPWHWHQAVELFYIENGSLEYSTPSSHHLFPAGSGGLININVPHMTKGYQAQHAGRQLLHLFDPALIAGHPGSRIEEKYVLPLTTASQVEIIALHPEDPTQAAVLELIRRSFQFRPGEPGYELHIRSVLSEIWLHLLETAAPQLTQKHRSSRSSEQLKLMMVYVHEHCSEKLSVTDLAKAACISERACFTLFQNHLHTTPMEYVKHHRLQTACKMLCQTQTPLSDIATACGLGSSSYFSRTFRLEMGCTPLEYRNRHQTAPPQEDPI